MGGPTDERHRPERRETRAPKPSRRRVLAAIGAGSLAGVAGCSGGGGGGDGGTGGSDGDSDGGDGGASTVAELCGRIPGGTVEYDAGATPVVCDFDIPSAFEASFGTGVGDFVHEGILRSEASEYGELTHSVQQMNDEGLVREEPTGAKGRETAVEIEFNGETVPFYAPREQVRPNGEDLALGKHSGSLPYTVGSTKLYFPVIVRTELDVPDAIPEECRTAVREVTTRTTESLRVNEETTVAQRIRDQWEDPP